MVFLERVKVGRLDDKYEIQIRAVGITVRDMAGADCVWPRFDDFAHFVVHFGHIVPVDCAFESVDDDAVVLDGISKIRVAESAVFPRSRDVSSEIKSVILSCNLLDVLHDVFLIAVFAVCET